MKKVVILGGGFAGITVGLTLSKNLNKHEADITLIDENTYHTFTPSLYEVATSEEPQKNIAIPLTNIFSGKLHLIISKIEIIDIQKQNITLSNGNTIPWDYLAICLGAQTNYYAIPGLEKYSYTLNTIDDAVKIKNSLNNIIQNNINDNQHINIIIGGGGFSGVELSAEIVNFRNNYIKKNPKYEKTINITILEATDQILRGLDPKISSIAQKRLKSFNVKIITDCLIKEVNDNSLETSENKTYPYDILIWTGGIKGNIILEQSNISVHKSGRVSVNKFLQVQDSDHIYAAGDCALFVDPNTQKPVPQTGQIAIDEAKIVGINIASAISEKSPINFNIKNYSYIIPLRGHFVIADLRFIKIFGLLGWVIQQMVFLRYLLTILPLSKALKKWNSFEQNLNQQ